MAAEVIDEILNFKLMSRSSSALPRHQHKTVSYSGKKFHDKYSRYSNKGEMIQLYWVYKNKITEATTRTVATNKQKQQKRK